jgi:mRNA-degrading endonuclease RelE of RelBE toxin-antitoxin system
MADEITKFLAQLPPKQLGVVLKLMRSIETNNINLQDSKKLSGSKDIFRLRKGTFRIIYKQNKNETVILSVTRRTEKTYRDF